MTNAMYIQLAPIELKEGIDEDTLLAASDAFQARFVAKEVGIRKRVLLKTKLGGYADLVFFDDKATADRVAQTELSSPECLEYFKIMKMPDESVPDMGVLSFEPIRTYGQDV